MDLLSAIAQNPDVTANSKLPVEVWNHSVHFGKEGWWSRPSATSSSKGNGVKHIVGGNIVMELNVIGRQGTVYQPYIMNANWFFRIQMGKHKRLWKL